MNKVFKVGLIGCGHIAETYFRAQEYFIITDVDNIYLNYKKENQEKIYKTTENELRNWLKDGHFGIGSMEPKIKSALYFLKHHGNKVVITSINKLPDAIKGQAGTHITKD